MKNLVIVVIIILTGANALWASDSLSYDYDKSIGSGPCETQGSHGSHVYGSLDFYNAVKVTNAPNSLIVEYSHVNSPVWEKFAINFNDKTVSAEFFRDNQKISSTVEKCRDLRIPCESDINDLRKVLTYTYSTLTELAERSAKPDQYGFIQVPFRPVFDCALLNLSDFEDGVKQLGL